MNEKVSEVLSSSSCCKAAGEAGEADGEEPATQPTVPAASEGTPGEPPRSRAAASLQLLSSSSPDGGARVGGEGG